MGPATKKEYEKLPLSVFSRKRDCEQKKDEGPPFATKTVRGGSGQREIIPP